MAATILSLFSGYGGLDLACDAAWPGGAHAVAYCEREAYAQAILLARMEEKALVPAPIWSDVTTFDGTPWRGVVDIVTAGFPCQPFSTAGRREGQDDERWLWGDIERVLREVRPRWLVLENVPGLVRHGLGPVLRTLAVLGYDAEWDLLSASAVGASHKRERIFILARRRDRVDDPDHRRHVHAEREIRTGRDAAVDAGGELADARSEGQEGGERPTGGEGRGDGSPADGPAPELRDPRLGRGLFAPGPDDSAWAPLLAHHPHLAPALPKGEAALPLLRRVPHGASSWLDERSDRLRALGNGVVPLQGAVAICSLAARAGWELE